MAMAATVATKITSNKETQETSRAVKQATIINGRNVLTTAMEITSKVTRATQPNTRLGMNLSQKERCNYSMTIVAT